MYLVLIMIMSMLYLNNLEVKKSMELHKFGEVTLLISLKDQIDLLPLHHPHPTLVEMVLFTLNKKMSVTQIRFLLEMN